MGFDNECILSIQSLPLEYLCAVCRTLVYPNEAVEAPCNHLFCKPCLAFVVSTTHACPYDGNRVEADTKPLWEAKKKLAEAIGKTLVRCLYYKSGCTWQGPLSDCTSHCSTCAFGESAILCGRCGMQLKHRQMKQHAHNCFEVHSQAQQPGGVQDSTSTRPMADPGQTNTSVQTGGPASQPTSQVSMSVVYIHDVSRTAGSVMQPQAAQSAVPTENQMYQQQAQYQQYYQQYVGFDPYQQIYLYPYQYPQVVQQYQQPHQQYPQVYSQPHPLACGPTQAQTEPVRQGQPYAPYQGAQPPLQSQDRKTVDAEPLALVPFTGQIQPQIQAPGQAQTYVQTNCQVQPEIMQPQGEAQSRMHAQGQVQPQIQPQGQTSMSHALSSNQAPPPPPPPPTQPQFLLQQQFPVHPYSQTHLQMQHPQMLPYPQSQTHHYPCSQLHSEPNLPICGNPSQLPIPPSTHLGTENAAIGYQSYPQPQPDPRAQNSNQMQGQFPLQTIQMRPQSYSTNVTNLQQPAMWPAQGPPPFQQPLMCPPQQPGHPFQQRPSVQATEQAFPRHCPFEQHQPALMAQGHSQGHSQMLPSGALPNVAHNFAGGPFGLQLVAHPYPQPTGHAGGGQVRPQLNENYPMKRNKQLPGAEKPTQCQRLDSDDKSGDQMLENGDHISTSKEAGDMVKASSRVSSRDEEVKNENVCGHAGAVQVKPPQLGLMETNRQLSSAEKLASHSQLVSSGEKSRDRMLEKGELLDNNTSKEARDMAKASSAGSRGDEVKPKATSDLGASSDGHYSGSCLSGSKQMFDAATKVDNLVQEANPNPMAKQETREGVSKPIGDADKIDSESASKKAEQQIVKYTANHASGSSSFRKRHLQSQVRDVNSHPSIDQIRNQLQPMPYGKSRPGGSSMPRSMGHHGNSQQPASLGLPSNQLRPQRPGQAPSDALPLENPALGILGAASAGSLGKPGNENYFQGNVLYHHASQPQYPSGDQRVRPAVTNHTHRPGVSGQDIDRFGTQRSGESHPHGPIERNSFGHTAHGIQQGALNSGGSSAHDSTPFLGMRDERSIPFVEQHSEHLPHRQFEVYFQKSSRPPLSEAEPSNYGTVLPSSGQPDHGSLMYGGGGTLKSFDMEPHGFDPAPGFDRPLMDSLPPRSAAKDYPSFPTQTFGPYGPIGGNESQSFECSKPCNFSAVPLGKPTHEGGFPIHPRGNLDVPVNLHLSEHLAHNRDFIPSHLQRGGHMAVTTHEHSRIEPPLGNFPSHIPFDDSFGGEKPRHPLQGEPDFSNGYGFPHFVHDGGFYPREMDHMRKRKSGCMCKICDVECETVEGLELHSQSAEHQRKAEEIALSFKQPNKKMQKISNDQARLEDGRDGGRSKSSGSEGR